MISLSKMLYFLLLVTIFQASSGQIDQWGASIISIVGGDVVDIKDYPYQARLENSKGLMCGASILTPHHLLCAARCIEYVKEPLTIHTGTSLLSDPGSVHHIQANYTMGKSSNSNLAVLRVVEPIIFDEYRQPIKLSTQEPQAGLVGLTLGWGYTDPRKFSISNELRAVKVPIVSREDCIRLYNGSYVGDITEGEICAGDLVEGGKDSCKGDAGSPLIVNGLQVGMVSKGYGCGDMRAPGIYVNIAHYYEWINRQIYN